MVLLAAFNNKCAHYSEIGIHTRMLDSIINQQRFSLFYVCNIIPASTMCTQITTVHLSLIFIGFLRCVIEIKSPQSMTRRAIDRVFMLHLDTLGSTQMLDHEAMKTAHCAPLRICIHKALPPAVANGSGFRRSTPVHLENGPVGSTRFRRH